MTSHHPTFSEVVPPQSFCGSELAGVSPVEEVVDRLRSVRLKVGRWLPSSEALAAWRSDYAEVFKTATRLDAAVGELDAYMAEHPDDCDVPSIHSLTLQMLLCNVEERADEFEESVLENLAAGN